MCEKSRREQKLATVKLRQRAPPEARAGMKAKAGNTSKPIFSYLLSQRACYSGADP
jgi:hypothetical protein